jgi:hypothetical protein
VSIAEIKFVHDHTLYADARLHLRWQHGAALMIMLIALVMGAATFLVASLNRSGLQIERDRVTVEALAQAKEALVAYAMSSENNSSELQPRPSNLPCPDTDAPGTSGYGDEQGSCAPGAIGRLPWKSLGIPEPVDSDGEPLWYAVSGNFLRRSMNGNVLNSDTAGTLGVYASNGATLLTSTSDMAVAVIFSPGKIVDPQQRGSDSEKTTASNYLETGPNNRNNANPGGPFIAADKTAAFNDRLVYIKASQLHHAIGRRVAGELGSLLNAYYAAWGAFPFAVPFVSPASAIYSGSSGTYHGLAPLDPLLGGTASLPAWNAAPSISFSDGATRLYCALSSGGWTDSRWRCCTTDSSCDSTSNITIPHGVTVTVTGRLNSVGLGLWRPHDITTTNEVRVRNSIGNTVLASSLLDNASVTGTLNYSDGSATVIFSGTGKPGGSVLRRIELRDIRSFSSVFPIWFDANDWEQVLYYATSQNYAPGGNHTCAPNCLTLNNQPASAVVVATGSSLDVASKPHPSGILSYYLEGSNAIPASGVYENRTLADNFNDKVISVAP